AAAKLGMGLGGDGTDLEILKKVQTSIQKVQAEVTSRAAAGELFLGKPGTDARNAIAAKPKRAGVVNLAQIAALDEDLGQLGVAVETIVLRDHDGALCLPSS